MKKIYKNYIIKIGGSMNKKLSGIVGIILSVVVLVYLETFIYKVLVLIDINISNYSIIVRTIIDLLIKVLICIMIYFIYKKDFNHIRNRDNIFKTSIILIVSVIILTIIMYLFNYVISYLCSIFKIEMIDREFYNIFDSKLKDLRMGHALNENDLCEIWDLIRAYEYLDSDFINNKIQKQIIEYYGRN